MRISGVDIPNEKRVIIALTYIFGIGPKSAEMICQKAGINPDTDQKKRTEIVKDAVKKLLEKFPPRR